MRGVIALSLLVAGTAGWAADPAPPAKPVKDSRVCRDAAETGTRIRSSECHLKSEWVEIDAARQKAYEDMNRRLGGLAAQQFPKAPTDH